MLLHIYLSHQMTKHPDICYSIFLEEIFHRKANKCFFSKLFNRPKIKKNNFPFFYIVTNNCFNTFLHIFCLFPQKFCVIIMVHKRQYFWNILYLHLLRLFRQLQDVIWSLFVVLFFICHS